MIRLRSVLFIVCRFLEGCGLLRFLRQGVGFRIGSGLEDDPAGARCARVVGSEAEVDGENALLASRKGFDRDPVVACGLPAAGGVDRHGLRAGSGFHRARRAVHVETVGGRRIVVLATARQTCA